jgi:hypothetical protein
LDLSAAWLEDLADEEVRAAAAAWLVGELQIQ